MVQAFMDRIHGNVQADNITRIQLKKLERKKARVRQEAKFK